MQQLRSTGRRLVNKRSRARHGLVGRQAEEWPLSVGCDAGGRRKSKNTKQDANGAPEPGNLYCACFLFYVPKFPEKPQPAHIFFESQFKGCRGLRDSSRSREIL